MIRRGRAQSPHSGMGCKIRFDTRWASLDAQSVQRLAKELVALQPDLILSHVTPTTAALLQQTHTVPRGLISTRLTTVHGGLSATLLDSCMGLSIQSTLDKGVIQTTLEFKISLVRPITP